MKAEKWILREHELVFVKGEIKMRKTVASNIFKIMKVRMR